MICKPCRRAADLLSMIVTDKAIKQAIKSHQQCEDCDCQHNVDAQLSGKAVYYEQYEPVGTTNSVVE